MSINRQLSRKKERKRLSRRSSERSREEFTLTLPDGVRCDGIYTTLPILVFPIFLLKGQNLQEDLKIFFVIDVLLT